jgi:hypothetical protein
MRGRPSRKRHAARCGNRPDGKVRYRDMRDATASLRPFKGAEAGAHVPVRPYFCDLCGGYHTTSQE